MSMYESSLELLNKKGIQLENGLTIDELKRIKDIYQFEFPNSLKEFLMTALPVSNGFYNWRDFSDDNVDYIKRAIERPKSDIYNMAEEVYWCDDWGEEPDNERIIAEEVRKRLAKAPKLIPLYGHRYMPIILNNNPPIISIHGVDIIYYGKNVEDYFKVEFGEKKQDLIDFQNIEHISFWSELM